jgi:hypothetical protein
MGGMRGIRQIRGAAAVVGSTALFWACSSFDGDARPASQGGDASPEAAPADDGAPPADAATATPCAKGGGTIWFASTFGTASAPSRVGWEMLASHDASSFVPLAAGAGAVGRGTIGAKTFGPSYAIAQKAGLPAAFAARFSFSMNALPDGYVVHQVYDSTQTTTNLTLSLQATGFKMLHENVGVIVGDRGSVGAPHTVVYSLDRTNADTAALKITFDGTPSEMVFSGATKPYDNFQIGPYWAPPAIAAPETVIDYADVTVWDCTR